MIRLHEHGFELESCGGALVFRDPRGREIAPAGELRAVVATAWDPEISPETYGTGWDGTPVDYELCLEAVGPRHDFVGSTTG